MSSFCSDHADSTAVDSRKGAWTAREDAALSARVSKYGTKSWTTIASGVEGRSAKSCRLRWYNQLCPGVKRTPFSEWEQAVIIKAQKIHTNKWAALAKLLKGRTDNAIKNHWNATLSRKLNNPAENFRNQFIEQGVSLEWLLAHPELDTSNDIEEALAARNYNSKVGLAALKGIKKKKRRSTPSSPSYSDGMLTPTAASSRPSKFQAVSKKGHSGLEPSSESGLTGTSRQAVSAATAAALPRSLSLQHQQQQPLYDSYGYSSYGAMPVGSSGGGLSSSSYSAAASMGHAPTCLMLAGGICSCWQGSSLGVQGYSTTPSSLAAGNATITTVTTGSLGGGVAGGAAAGTSYVNYPDGSLQPVQLQSWQQGGLMGDLTGYGAVGDYGGSPFAVFGGSGGDNTPVGGELAGSSTHLQSAGGAAAGGAGAGASAAAAAVVDPAAAAAAVVKAEQQGGGGVTSAAAAGAADTCNPSQQQQQQVHDQQQPSSSSMSSGSPVRPGLVASCGNVTPPPSGSIDRSHSTTDIAAAAAASSKTTTTTAMTAAAGGADSSHKITSHLGPNPTGAWASQGLVMGPPSDALGPLGLRPVGQGKLLSPATYDMLMSGVVPSSRGGVDVQYSKSGSNAAAAGALAAAAGGGGRSSGGGGLLSPGRTSSQQQQTTASQLQLQHSMPAPTTAPFNTSSGGGYGGGPSSQGGGMDPSSSARPMANGLGRSFSYDVSFNPMLGPPPTAGGPGGSAGGAYPPGPSSYMAAGGGRSSGGGGGGGAPYNASLPPNMPRGVGANMPRSYSTPPGYGLPPPGANMMGVGGLSYSTGGSMGGGRPSAGGGGPGGMAALGGCGVPGCTDPACWGYVGAAAGAAGGVGGPGLMPGDSSAALPLPPSMLPPGLPMPPYNGAGGGGGLYGAPPGLVGGMPGAQPGGMLSSYGSAPAPGGMLGPQGRRSGSASGLPESFFGCAGMGVGHAGGPGLVGYGGSRSAGGGLQQQYNQHNNQQQHDVVGGDLLLGMPAGLLGDGPPGVSSLLTKQQGVGGGAAMQRQQQQRSHQQQQQSPQQQLGKQPPAGTPAFSWDSVGEALQGFGEGADDSLAWDELADFDLPDLKQHEVDELLNF